ncbi:MAG: thiaminase II [Alphaproteobacteria bacterium]
MPDPGPSELAPPESLFARLREAAGATWRRYVEHDFVRGLATASLPEPSFRHYLGQDYLFLVHLARAYALAAYKADGLREMRDAAAGMSAILDVEMGLHVKYCAGWGLDEEGMAALPEASATLAYTRYVLEAGQRGDLLDLYTALAPCVVGYAEIGARLAGDPETVRAGNPYAEWIETYAGEEYQTVARDHVAALDRLWRARAGGGRFDVLARTFTQATRLEIDFWQMGLDALAP